MCVSVCVIVGGSKGRRNVGGFIFYLNIKEIYTNTYCQLIRVQGQLKKVLCYKSYANHGIIRDITHLKHELPHHD